MLFFYFDFCFKIHSNKEIAIKILSDPKSIKNIRIIFGMIKFDHN